MKKQSQFENGEMNVSLFMGKDYGNRWQRRVRKNKANQSQSSYSTAENAQCAEVLDVYSLCFLCGLGGLCGQCHLKKQSQFENGQMNGTSIIIKDYANMGALGLRKNKANSKPIKACPERSRMGQFHLPPKG